MQCVCLRARRCFESLPILSSAQPQHWAHNSARDHQRNIRDKLVVGKPFHECFSAALLPYQHWTLKLAIANCLCARLIIQVRQCTVQLLTKNWAALGSGLKFNKKRKRVRELVEPKHSQCTVATSPVCLHPSNRARYCSAKRTLSVAPILSTISPTSWNTNLCRLSAYSCPMDEKYVVACGWQIFPQKHYRKNVAKTSAIAVI